jgi:hypothetical protein
MNIADMVEQYSNYFQIPPSIMFLGPIALALALQIMKSSESRRKLHSSGAWKGLKVEGGGSQTVATLCSLIFIVTMTYSGYYFYNYGSPPPFVNPAYYMGR